MNAVTDDMTHDDYIASIEQINNMTTVLSQRTGANSKLITLIKIAGIKNAERAASSACKTICFYIESFVKNLHERDFPQFLTECVALNYIRSKDFWLQATQAEMVKHYSDTARVVEINDYDDFMEHLKTGKKIGTVRIKIGKYDNGTDKKHSIIACSDPATSMPVLYDTGSRGHGVPVEKYVDKDNFVYFTYIDKRGGK